MVRSTARRVATYLAGGHLAIEQFGMELDGEYSGAREVRRRSRGRPDGVGRETVVPEVIFKLARPRGRAVVQRVLAVLAHLPDETAASGRTLMTVSGHARSNAKTV